MIECCNGNEDLLYLNGEASTLLHEETLIHIQILLTKSNCDS